MNANEQILIWLLQRIEAVLPHVSSERILNEMQISIERMSFYAAAEGTDAGTSEFPPLVELFEGDVSGQLTELLQAMVTQGYIRVLIGPQGRATLAYCAKHFSDIPEIVFASAVELSGETKQEILQLLRTKHPEPNKIIFQVIPALVAGFRVYGVSGKSDYSLRTAMNDTIPTYVKQKMVAGITGGNNGS